MCVILSSTTPSSCWVLPKTHESAAPKVLLLCQKFQKKEKKDFKDQDIILEDQNIASWFLQGGLPCEFFQIAAYMSSRSCTRSTSLPQRELQFKVFASWWSHIRPSHALSSCLLHAVVCQKDQQHDQGCRKQLTHGFLRREPGNLFASAKTNTLSCLVSSQRIIMGQIL